MRKLKLGDIKRDIKSLADSFGLKYKQHLYNVTYLHPKEFTILQFLAGCPHRSYSKFGKTIIKRLKNINKFLSSQDFKMLIKKRAKGSVISARMFSNAIRKLRDKKIKIECEKILKKLKLSIREKAVVLVSPIKEILFHEWIHILLISNKIHFQRINHNYWTLDEGLTVYLQTFFEKKKTDISNIMKRRLKGSYKRYAENALKFNTLLKDKKSPAERKKAILDFYKKLKHQYQPSSQQHQNSRKPQLF